MYGCKSKGSQDSNQIARTRQYGRQPTQPLSRFGTSMSILMGMRRRKGYGSDISKSKKPSVKIQNSYKLRPSTGEIFDASKIEGIIKETLNSELNDVEYQAETARELTCKISNIIETRVKSLNMPRFKIVCYVILGENKEQGLEIASRCLWDSQYDNWACASYENDTICATASVYGIYFE